MYKDFLGGRLISGGGFGTLNIVDTASVLSNRRFFYFQIAIPQNVSAIANKMNLVKTIDMNNYNNLILAYFAQT